MNTLDKPKDAFAPRAASSMIAAALLFALAWILPASAGSATADSNGTTVARQAFNRKLGETILTTNAGLTLYSLSVEAKGRFVCTDKSCVSEWHPLDAPRGSRPAGPVALRTVRRPDGSLQVTYGGKPLYTFAGDRAPGQVKGEGIKDVGTWHAAIVARHGK